MRIALMRSGTVLYADNHDASPVAGNQDALGVLRYLKQSGHEVCLFGPAKGDFGVPVINVDFSGTPYETTKPEEYDFRLNFALTELRHWAPEVCVNVAGQQPSHSNPMNPWGTHPLRTAITTNYPMLKACELLKLKRIVIMNDPRNLPREHENHYWQHTLPWAVLSQRTKTTRWTTRERVMERREVYAGCENWWTYGMPLAPLDTPREGVVIIAHTHVHDLRVYGPERAKTWDAVLGKFEGLRNGAKLEIYGQGWEDFAAKYKGESPWKGLIKHDQVQGVLQQASQGPMIALEAGFATGKLREYVVAGALPRPISWGKFHYDKDNRYLAANHPARIKQFEPWGEIPWAEARGYVEELRQLSTPNFDPLESALESVKTLQPPGGWGGYRWV